MKTRNKLEKEGQKGLTGFQGKKPARILKENDKNWWWSQVQTRRERGTFEKVWIVTLKKSYSAFLKTRNTSFDWSKNSLDQSKQTETPTLKNFRILKISIGRKIDWTDRIRQRLTKFLWKTQFLKNKKI